MSEVVVRLSRKELAAALVESGFIARFQDYALRAHPETMKRDKPEEVAWSWAGDILVALNRSGAAGSEGEGSGKGDGG